MARILVTGATGFIGRYVVSALLQKGAEVMITSTKPADVQSPEWAGKVRWILFDLKLFDPAVHTASFFGNPDAVLHLIWEDLPRYKESFHETDNLPRHQAFLKSLLDQGLKDLTVTGTCLEYGLQEGCMKEEMPVHPIVPYAIAKHRLQQYVTELTGAHSVAFKWLRLFYVYGRGQSANSLFSQLEKAVQQSVAVFNMSPGDQIRDFLPVEEMAEYIALAAMQNKVTGIINIGSGNPVSVEDMVNGFLKEKGKKIQLHKGYYPYPDYEPRAFWADTQKLKKITTYVRSDRSI